MKGKQIILIGMILLFVNIISASSYYVEFNQVKDRILVNESVNGIENTYYDSNIIDRNNGEIYFVKRLNFKEDFDEVVIKLNLDNGIIVEKELIFPVNYEFGTNGKTISISWKANNVKANQDFPIFVTLKDVKYNSYLYIGWVLVFLAFIYAIYLTYRLFKIKKTIRIDRKKNVSENKINNKKYNEKYDYLLDDEKRVIEELRKAERNEMWQKQLQNITGFSKAKVSRLIRNLESRGLIRKIPFGNTNKIRLK